MDIKMKYIYTLYQEKSFTQAAKRLFIAQSSLSAMVKRVELELGAELFDRSTKPLELTEAGQVYIDYILQTVQCERELNEKIWDIQNLNRGHIRVGASNYLLSSILPIILQHLLARYPEIEIELEEASSPALYHMLKNDELDILVDSFDLTDDTLAYHHLADERILLAVPKENPLNRKLLPYRFTQRTLHNAPFEISPLPEEDAVSLLREPLILCKPGNDTRIRANRVFQRFQLPPKVLLEFDQLSTCLNYAEAGLGASFIPDTPLCYWKQQYRVYLYYIEDPNLLRKQYIVHKKGRHLSNASRLFIQTARELFGQDLP